MAPTATHEQIEMLLTFMAEHLDFARGRLIRDIEGRNTANRLWETITNRLNSVGGAHKTKVQWQKVWTDKKYIARKAAANNRKSATATGGGPADCAPMSTIEQRVVNIMGPGFGEPQTTAMTPAFAFAELPRPSVTTTTMNNDQATTSASHHHDHQQTQDSSSGSVHLSEDEGFRSHGDEDINEDATLSTQEDPTSFHIEDHMYTDIGGNTLPRSQGARGNAPRSRGGIRGTGGAGSRQLLTVPDVRTRLFNSEQKKKKVLTGIKEALNELVSISRQIIRREQ